MAISPSPADPLGDVWDDAAWQEARIAELTSMFESPLEFTRDDVDGGVWAGRESGAFHDDALDRLQLAAQEARTLIADQYRVIAEILREAAECPDPWVGPDPTLDPAWIDPRDRSVGAVRRERVDFAVRAAAADVAVRLHLSETSVRARAAHAEVLRERCPRLWSAFLGGVVPETHATASAQLAASLPDAPQVWRLFDERVLAVASRLTAAKFRIAARAIRERVHAESLEERHRRATRDRGVWMNAELDGMATFMALLPAANAHAAMGTLDAIARHLRVVDGETRTLAQLRADALTDLIASATGSADLARAEDPRSADEPTTGAGITATGAGIAATVAITVPVLSLLGESEEPATLEGYGPIDLDTAKRLAGGATSWVRILTHPVTGTPLDLDRTTYRVPTALRRWLGVVHSTCVFPGCARPARQCHIDHRLAWEHGGSTRDINLAPECEPHHRVKHGSLWELETDPHNGEISWLSPSGYRIDADPPPF